jgi:hypothetical protein
MENFFLFFDEGVSRTDLVLGRLLKKWVRRFTRTLIKDDFTRGFHRW